MAVESQFGRQKSEMGRAGDCSARPLCFPVRSSRDCPIHFERAVCPSRTISFAPFLIALISRGSQWQAMSLSDRSVRGRTALTVEEDQARSVGRREVVEFFCSLVDAF